MVRDTVENCLFAKKVSGEGVILRGGGGGGILGGGWEGSYFWKRQQEMGYPTVLFVTVTTAYYVEEV